MSVEVYLIEHKCYLIGYVILFMTGLCLMYAVQTKLYECAENCGNIPPGKAQ